MLKMKQFASTFIGGALMVMVQLSMKVLNPILTVLEDNMWTVDAEHTSRFGVLVLGRMSDVPLKGLRLRHLPQLNFALHITHYTLQISIICKILGINYQLRYW